MYDYGSPQNRQIVSRQSENKIIWSTEPWLFKRIVFLSSPSCRGGCIWCGNIPSVVCHPGTVEVYRSKDTYLDFRKAGCYPMCVPCNNAERKGMVLCPRCRKQGHYVPAGIDGKGDGKVCWTCKPADERERILFQRDQKRRDRANMDRVRYRRAHGFTKIVGKDGKWIRVPR